ncbi:hypothetical protein C8T65DRAFT_663275 [Cerioporus squamosus]|nr:hypothetical protein C8T65DRAFT_663275 [Cerioporus squamosus]
MIQDTYSAMPARAAWAWEVWGKIWGTGMSTYGGYISPDRRSHRLNVALTLPARQSLAESMHHPTLFRRKRTSHPPG